MDKLETNTLLAEIERLQNTQKRNHPDTLVWREASARLAPLFDEMARRQSSERAS